MLAAAIIAFFFALATSGLWFWLMWLILTHIQATTTMWILYWLFVPSQLFTSTILALVKREK